MRNENQLPIVVYSTPGCVQCNMTKKWLEANDLRYREVNLSEDQIALQTVKQMGYQAAPVVIVPFDYPNGGSHWSGFQPDRLKELLA